MRATIATILGGALLGVLLGFGIGKYQSSFRAWTPENETNQLAAQARKEADDASKKTENAKTDGGPKAKVGETAFDFGILEKTAANEKGEHPFYIENVGDAELTLADGGKGCFCTDFSISKSSLKPGEKATVLFKWDGARSGGVFDQGVRVLTNDPNAREIYFTVSGLYTAPIVSAPNELSFQNASAATDTTREFRVFGFERDENGEPFPLEILGVETSDPDRLTVELKKDDVANLTPKERGHQLYSKTTNLFVGTATLKAGAPQGAFQEIIRVKTNSAKEPTLEIVASGQVSGGGVKLVGRRFDEKATGFLLIDTVSQKTTTEERLRLIFNKIPANAETVKVKSVRPDWLKVDFVFPPEEMQKTAPTRIVEAIVSIPAGSPQGSFMGPNKEQLGEIVFTVGETPETTQEIVLPVRFAVGP